MRTAKWHADGPGFWIWLGHYGFESRSDLFPALRSWMEVFIKGHPYILMDVMDDPWVQKNLETYRSSVAFVGDKRNRRYVLVGSDTPTLLRSHQEEYGLGWIGGLKVHVFEEIGDMEAQLRAWDGQPVAALETSARVPLVSLTTGGDAEGLYVEPGRQTLQGLLEEGRQAAASLGFEWGPLVQ